MQKLIAFVLLIVGQVLFAQNYDMDFDTKEILNIKENEVWYRGPDQAMIKLKVLNFESKNGLISQYLIKVSFPNQPHLVYEIYQENLWICGYYVICKNPDGSKQTFNSVYFEKGNLSMDFKLIQYKNILGCWVKKDTVIEVSKDLQIKMLYPKTNSGKLIWINRIKDDFTLVFNEESIKFNKDWEHLVDLRSEAIPFIEFCNARFSHNYTTGLFMHLNSDTIFTDKKTGEQMFFHFQYSDKYASVNADLKVYYQSNAKSKPIALEIVKNIPYQLVVKFPQASQTYQIDYKLNNNPQLQIEHYILTNPDGSKQTYQRH